MRFHQSRVEDCDADTAAVETGVCTRPGVGAHLRCRAAGDRFDRARGSIHGSIRRDADHVPALRESVELRRREVGARVEDSPERAALEAVEVDVDGPPRMTQLDEAQIVREGRRRWPDRACGRGRARGVRIDGVVVDRDRHPAVALGVAASVLVEAFAFAPGARRQVGIARRRLAVPVRDPDVIRLGVARAERVDQVGDPRGAAAVDARQVSARM